MKKEFKILILGIGFLSLLIILSLTIIHRSISLASSSSELSGWAWSENIGWISFNESDTGVPPSDDPCPDASCIAKATPSGQLGSSDVPIYGWARALAHDGGWDGWIRFDHGKSGEVYIDSSGDLHGWAWGGEVVGWISFNGSDPNAGGNYKVSVPLGYASSGNLISVIYDTQEGEGVTLTGIVWHGTMPSGTSVAFELCSSDSTVPTDFTCTGPYTSRTWKPAENWWQVTIPLSDLSFHNNRRYIRYKVYLYPDASRSQTPVVDDIIMKWAK